MGTAVAKLLLLCLSLTIAVNGLAIVNPTGAGALYRGKYIGRLQPRQHKVSGEVYAVDARTLHIRGFTYDGTGPDAFFWTGFTESPSPQGIIVPDERGTKEVLGTYNNQDITITLPDGLTLRDIKWFGVWCRAYEVNFGDLYISPDLDFPQPHVIGSLSGQHGVSSGPIVVVDAQTILVPDFVYDGQAPDVHFWTGKGKPGPEGIRIPDETGGETPLVKSDKKTMVLSLPGDLTIFDIDFFGVWCRLYYVDFGHVKVPPNLNVPPSLRMLGVTPQTKLNCEVLYDDLALEVRWALAGESIVLQIVGRIEPDTYMAFGLSGDDSRSQMINGDVVVGWFEKETGRGNIVDYYLDSKSQCSGRRGTCPDTRFQAGTNNVRLLSAALVNGFTMLTFQRPLRAHDELDKTIYTNASQSVIWAVGPVNQRKEASYHTLRNKDDLFIEFGRPPLWNCPAPDSELASTKGSPVPQLSPNPISSQVHSMDPVSTHVGEMESGSKGKQELRPHGSQTPKGNAWRVPPIYCHEPEDRVFYAQMGPTGGSRGYNAITGHVGWGIAWYINGLLVPEVYVVRGRTYTFVVEGGDNPEIPAKYHPFYITDDPEGSYQHKSQEEKQNVRVFAGVGIDSRGRNLPTSTGRLCQWTENGDQPADSFPSYGAYQRSLSLQCDDGHPGILHWTPDKNTPDLVYYQCYTHRYLGWKIHVLDSCPTEAEAGAEGSETIHQDQEIEESIHHSKRIPSPNSVNTMEPSENPRPPTVSPFIFTSADNGSAAVADNVPENIKQEVGRPPFRPLGNPDLGSFPHLAQDGFLRGRPYIPGIYPPHGPPQFPVDGPVMRNPDSQHQHTFPFNGGFGGGGMEFGPPKPDYFLGGGTRGSLGPHSIRIDGAQSPAFVYQSTIAPPMLQQSLKLDDKDPMLQGSLVRIKDMRGRPELVPMSPDQLKFFEAMRTGDEGRRRPPWPHGRNLPKREGLYRPERRSVDKSFEDNKEKVLVPRMIEEPGKVHDMDDGKDIDLSEKKSSPIEVYFPDEKVGEHPNEEDGGVTGDEEINSFTDPKLENFMPVFRPSPLDVGRFNVSKDFPRQSGSSNILIPVRVVQQESKILMAKAHLPRHPVPPFRLSPKAQLIYQDHTRGPRPNFFHHLNLSRKPLKQSDKRHKNFFEMKDLLPAGNERPPGIFISQDGNYDHLRMAPPSVPRAPRPFLTRIPDPPRLPLHNKLQFIPYNRGEIHMPAMPKFPGSLPQPPQFFNRKPGRPHDGHREILRAPVQDEGSRPRGQPPIEAYEDAQGGPKRKPVSNDVTVGSKMEEQNFDAGKPHDPISRRNSDSHSSTNREETSDARKGEIIQTTHQPSLSAQEEKGLSLPLVPRPVHLRPHVHLRSVREIKESGGTKGRLERSPDHNEGHSHDEHQVSAAGSPPALALLLLVLNFVLLR